jgi:hypothetical protein
VLSSYGPAEVDFMPHPANFPPNFIEDVLSSLAKRDQSDFTWYADQNEPEIGYKFQFCKDGFGFFYFENGSDETTLVASIRLNQFQGCKLCKKIYNF